MVATIKICEKCKNEFTLNPRLGLNWAKKTGRGRFCSDKCSREARKGQRVSVATEFKKGQMAGSKHPKWKGGRETTKLGYIMAYAPDHPNAHKGKVLEHRLVMEKHLGRYLEDNETVHHANGIRNDNSLGNLILFENHSEHIKHHWRERGYNVK